MKKRAKVLIALMLAAMMSVPCSSVVYAGADEDRSVKTTENESEKDTEGKEGKDSEGEGEDAPTICNEGNHELVEERVVLPTCTTPGYTVFKCKVAGCTYEENRNPTEPLKHDLKEISREEATTEKTGTITYKCQRKGCEYEETVEIPLKEPEEPKPGNEPTPGEEQKPGDGQNPGEDNKSEGEEKPAEDGKTEPGKNTEETVTPTESANNTENSASDKTDKEDSELPEEDIDEEYLTYSSSTSTSVVAEYDPTTANDTIKVSTSDKDTEQEKEVSGRTVPTGTTEIVRDEKGNITDLAVSTELDEIQNGFSLKSEAGTLHSVSIINKKDPKNHWITLSAKKSASELGIRFYNVDDKVIMTLTENEKPLNITKVTDDTKKITLTTSTGGTCEITKNVQKFYINEQHKITAKANQVVFDDLEGEKTEVAFQYVKDNTNLVKKEEADETTESDHESETESELYWIRPFNDDNQTPVVITIYKKQ